MIGKIKRVPLREVWRHEARDFTTWLQTNIDILCEVIDMELTNVEREQSTGNFSVDLVAEDASGNTVIIENQLEKSDHDHLGKLVTYLAAVEAKAAVWIVADARAEHVAAVSWLNQSPQNNFYIVKLEAIKIDTSDSAALLTLIVGPTEEGKNIGKSKGERAERDATLIRFWTHLLERSNKTTKLFQGISPSGSSYVQKTAGVSGISYIYNSKKHDSRIGLYLGSPAKVDDNRKRFDHLYESKEQIDKDFGEPLVWERLVGTRASRITSPVSEGGFADAEEKWPFIQDAMIERMVRFHDALAPHVKALE